MNILCYNFQRRLLSLYILIFCVVDGETIEYLEDEEQDEEQDDEEQDDVQDSMDYVQDNEHRSGNLVDGLLANIQADVNEGQALLEGMTNDDGMLVDAAVTVKRTREEMSTDTGETGQESFPRITLERLPEQQRPQR